MPGWLRIALKGLGGVLLAIVLAAAAAVWFVDTGPGHRFLTDRIAALAPATGLRIRIGRIEGSIWNRATLRDVRLYDPRGLWLEAPAIDLDWRPAAWANNRLDIRSLSSSLVILHRSPRFTPTGRQGPILPGFDIHIGRLDARLRLEAAVAGQRRLARIVGRADIRDGRALIDAAASATGGDRLRVMLDAAPDADRFDLEARLSAPAGGTVGGMLGTKRPMRAAIVGDGSWSRWRGRGRLDLSGSTAADLALAADAGRYGLTGLIAPAPFTSGKVQRLTTPRLAVAGRATLEDRQLDGRLSLKSQALDVVAAGGIDLADSAFRKLDLHIRLLQPRALFPNMTGRAIAADVRLDGPFRTAAFSYRAAVPRLAFDTTGFEEVRAHGNGRLGASPTLVPVHLTARRVTGVGDVAGGILGNLKVDGVLKVTARQLTGDGLVLTSDKLKTKLSLLLNLVTGDYSVALTGGLSRYLIPGLGIVDVTSELRVVPGPGGRGTVVTGRGRAQVRRLDNAFFRSLAGGLPRIETRLTRMPDGTIRFTDLILTAPSIRIAGSGLRRRDGTFQFSGRGRQATYGPLTIALDGNIARPKLDLTFERPMDALGLAAVKARLDPTPQGYAFTAAGGSTLGPFDARGAILLPSGAAATIRVDALNVTGTTARGSLRSDTGGFTGRMDVAGGGISGPLDFSVVNGVQRIEGHLAARETRLGGIADVSMRRGRLDSVLLLDPAGLSVEGTVGALGMRRGPVSLARLSVTASMRGGRGRVVADFAGTRGRTFAFRTRAQIDGDAVILTGGGTVDGRPLSLTAPARIVRTPLGWRLDSAALTFAGGTARLSGRFGDVTAVDATIARMPLAVLDVVRPGLGLGGLASGRVVYSSVPGQAPTGRVDLRVAGLTRAGLVVVSRPIDLGLAAVLTPSGVAARAVATSGGQTIGRAQARIAPLPAGGGLADRLTRAPLFAQVRYAGPADTLWRLTGVEGIDLSGPAEIGADVTGTLADPRILGSLRTRTARLESSLTGTVITNLAAAGRFDGSRLVIPQFSGHTKGGGTVAGRATFDLASTQGFAMDIALRADRATLLERDDLGATVTGPLTLKADARGGVIGGDVVMERGFFRLGRAAAATIPRLTVRELNRRPDEAEPEAAPITWALDLKAKARSRLMVTGLGLDSEWRADLGLAGTVDAPRISGRVDLIRGGYQFAGRRFDLDRGVIRFTGTSPVDPVLDIVAIANLQGLNATIRITGTGLRPDIDFASIPALPEDELLSRILFGTSITNLSAPEALQLAAAVASLRQSGTGSGLNLDPINAIRKAVRLDRLRILPADLANRQGTSLAAGKYIGRRTYVELITDGQGYSATRVEFQITRWLSLLSTVSTIGRQSANVRVSRDY